MTTIEEALVTLIENNEDITAIVEDRIRAVELPLDCPLPAISYTVISDPNHQIVGYPRIQLSVFAKTYPMAKLISNYLRVMLAGYTGIVDGKHIIRISPENSLDLSDSSAGVYHIENDYKVIYRR